MFVDDGGVKLLALSKESLDRGGADHAGAAAAIVENELLAEIAKEEEELRIKLEETYNLLVEAEAKLIRETLELTSASIKPEMKVKPKTAP